MVGDARASMRAGEQRLIGVLGDQDTISGFLLIGASEASANGQALSGNCILITESSAKDDVLRAFRTLCDRKDIGVILINQHIANKIRDTIDQYDKLFPAILEIPSKDYVYDFSKDSALVKIKKILGEE